MPWVNTVAKQDYASGQLRHAGGVMLIFLPNLAEQTRVELNTSNIRSG